MAIILLLISPSEKIVPNMPASINEILKISEENPFAEYIGVFPSEPASSLRKFFVQLKSNEKYIEINMPKKSMTGVNEPNIADNLR